ncbi:MAG: DNA repair helicase XPB [Acidimicrobiales bacterium]
MTAPAGSGPLLLPAPDTVLLNLAHPDAEAARSELARFAELDTAPEGLHTYRLTDLGLWNAAAAGVTAERMIDTLRRWSAAPVPHAVEAAITDTMARFGRVVIEGGAPPAGLGPDGRPDGPDSRRGGSGGPEVGDGGPGSLVVRFADRELADVMLADDEVARHLGPRLDLVRAVLDPLDRGALKQTLLARRWPADDRAALSPGLPHPFRLDPDLKLRPYQEAAVEAWLPSGTGVIVLPCGAGKTVTGIATAAAVGSRTLILTTGEAAVDQWRTELERFTDLDPDDIGVYSARRREVRPITLTTYHLLATRRGGVFRHLDLLQGGDWGLVIYDEVHLLPSAVFQLTAGIQSRRRLGLTATLVREDGRQRDVFGLVGPKRYDVGWRDLELQGWLAPATCTEIRIPPTADERLAHASAPIRQRAQVAAAVGGKLDVVAELVERHRGEQVLIIGTYLDGLVAVADRLGLPIVTGQTPAAERLHRFEQLRTGEIDVLVVSKVGNTSIDLPEVAVAIQVSGTYGSRQEEAQRLGRIVRPKRDGRQAHFYTLVGQDTVEVDHARRRQRFLAEQGYGYEIVDAAAPGVRSGPSGG